MQNQHINFPAYTLITIQNSDLKILWIFRIVANALNTQIEFSLRASALKWWKEIYKLSAFSPTPTPWGFNEAI